MSDLSGLSTFYKNTTNVTVIIDSVANYFDNVMRVIAVIIHLVYFGFIIHLKDFRIRQMIYLHNVNFVGFVYCLHYLCYISSQSPTFSDQLINDILCWFSSMLWLSLKYLRMYSLLLLAFYRYIAVFHITFHRTFTKNLCRMILGIVFVWIFSISISLIIKYAFKTKYSIFYCFEGNSDDMNIVIGFLVVNNLTAIIIPMLLIIYVYIRIMLKVRELTSKLSKQVYYKNDSKGNFNVLQLVKTIKLNKVRSQSSKITQQDTMNTLNNSTRTISTNTNTNSSNGGSRAQIKRNKQTNMALQLILINGSMILGSIFLIVIDVTLNLATSNNNFYILTQSQFSRPIFRFIFLFTQSLIPILSIVLSAWKK